MSTTILPRQAPPDISYWSIIRLALPIWISNLAIVGGGTIDTLMAGHLGATQLAGVAIGTAVTVSIFVALVGVMQGLSPIAGHHYGAGHHKKIGYELHQTLWIAFVLSAVGITLMTYTPLWLTLTNAKGEVAAVATSFLIYNAFGLPGAMAGRGYMALNAAVSRPKIAMYIALAALILKIPVNFLFIYGAGPIPAFEGAGCAISSSICGWFNLLCYWLIWHYDTFYEKMRQERFAMPDFKVIANQLKLGIPIGISAFFEVTSFTFMTIFISRLGETIVSGHQIVANLSSLFYMAPLAIGVSCTVLVSQSMGAKSPLNAKIATQKCLKFCIAMACCVSVLLYFAKSFFVSLYTNDGQVAAVAVVLISFACVYHVFDSINCVGSFALRGYRITFIPMLLYGVLLWGVGLGLGSIFTFTDFLTPRPLGAKGYWLAITIGLTLSGLAVGAIALSVSSRVEKGLLVRVR